MSYTFSIVIPLWNESKCIPDLVEMLASSAVIRDGTEVLMINNGSQDGSKELLDLYQDKHSWLKVIHLDKNENYGGGIFRGIQSAIGKYIGYIPGDLQVEVQDLEKACLRIKELSSASDRLVVKGCRVIRKDPWHTRFVSKIYSFFARTILDLDVKDVNGLPKVFSRTLVPYLEQPTSKNFVFDAELLAIATRNKFQIEEIPVGFYARRKGVSSWSSKRLRTYFQSMKQLIEIRSILKKRKCHVDRDVSQD